jgi:hypothetical protein
MTEEDYDAFDKQHAFVLNLLNEARTRCEDAVVDRLCELETTKFNRNNSPRIMSDVHRIAWKSIWIDNAIAQLRYLSEGLHEDEETESEEQPEA